MVKRAKRKRMKKGHKKWSLGGGDAELEGKNDEKCQNSRKKKNEINSSKNNWNMK